MEPTQIRLTIPDNVDPTLVMGPADALLRRIEDAFDAMVVVRGNQVMVVGDTSEVDQAVSVFSRLISLVSVGESPSVEDVDLIIGQVSHGAAGPISLDDDVVATYRGKAIRPKTEGQKRYVDSIRRNTITFGLGPAGTGKTYLAMAMAVAALRRHDVARIVLVRPVVEAGESLGFLPGTLEEKLDPYIRPLYDALFDMTDVERGNELIEQGVIEVAPLAFMRGRTLNNAFVILDEAQNTTPDQMKMFLTRLGYSSTFVVTGDVTQRDLLGEKLEEECLDLFPNAKILRMDRDTTKEKDGYDKIIEKFGNGDADILIGTQMIIKGHDFPNVSLVAIMRADLTLYNESYKASEETFSMLTQCVGRSGRKVSGESIIQTYEPDNEILNLVKKQDYEEFYNNVISYRKKLKYPPFSKLLHIKACSSNFDYLDDMCKNIKIILDKKNNNNATILGPAKLNPEKIKDIYYRQFTVKCNNKEDAIKFRSLTQKFVNYADKFNLIKLIYDIE